MDLMQDFLGGLWISSYSHAQNDADQSAYVAVAGAPYSCSIALSTSGKVVRLPELSSDNLIEALNLSDVDVLAELGWGTGNVLECCLLGVGDMSLLWRWVEIDLFRQLQQQSCVVDVMGFDAACRTYNVLASEGRHVAAFLIL